MNKANLFLFCIIHMNVMSCSAMYKNNNQKTLSTLFKLSNKNPNTAQEFYQQTITRFNQHTEELYNELFETQINTANRAQICSKIITEDLIPLNYKICNILKYITQHNLYRNSYCEQTHANPEESPRIKIINSVIDDLKNFNNILLDDTRIEYYQLLINRVAYFSVTESHHEKDYQFLEALKTISINNELDAQKLAILLNAETLNREELKKIKK